MEKNDKSKPFVISLISVVIMILVIISFAYAYFTAIINGNTSFNVGANISSTYKPVLTATKSGDLLLSVGAEDMFEWNSSSNNNVVADSSTQSLHVNLSGGGNETSFICSYDIIWEDHSQEAYVPSPKAAAASLKEYTIKIVDENASVVLAERGIDTLTSGQMIVENETLVASGNQVTKTYLITVTMYNLNVEQTIYNKNYDSLISIANLECQES